MRWGTANERWQRNNMQAFEMWAENKTGFSLENACYHTWGNIILNNILSGKAKHGNHLFYKGIFWLIEDSESDRCVLSTTVTAGTSKFKFAAAATWGTQINPPALMVRVYQLIYTFTENLNLWSFTWRPSAVPRDTAWWQSGWTLFPAG